MKKIYFIFLICLICSCTFTQSESLDPIQSSPTNTPSIVISKTATSTITPTIKPTSTSTNTLTATKTFTPTITKTKTLTFTPTFNFPVVSVNTQAHCRYGPSSSYLHAADLYPGDTGTVRSRYINSQWLYVKFDKLNYWCWVSPSVIDIVGDITTVIFIEPDLQSIGSNIYGSPQNVQAFRNGEEVTISWDQMAMTDDDDRGYFIEGWRCQNGAYFWWTISFSNQYTTSYTVVDEEGCNGPSFASIYTVEKHGYSLPAVIPWP